jgi:transposase
MRALEPEVVDAVWAAVEPLLPPPDRSHPLGCHRPRFLTGCASGGSVIRLVTGASWVDIEAILDHQVSDTTLRARRDEWIDAGVFEALKTEALAAFDRIIGLDLDDVAIDGSLHKAPYGGEGTGPNPTDRGKSGWKWSVAADRHGIPIGWTIDGANRNDVRLLDPTLDAVDHAGLLADIGTCTSTAATTPAVRDRARARGITEFDIQLRGTKVPPSRSSPHGSGCAGSSRPPTRGGRTTASSAATPTAAYATATPPSASPPPCSSSADSSTWRDRWSNRLTPIRSGPSGPGGYAAWGWLFCWVVAPRASVQRLLPRLRSIWSRQQPKQIDSLLNDGNATSVSARS